MKNYTADNIRNIAFVGHGGEGKTTLCEAMLLNAGSIDRMGRVEDGTTATDFDAEEIKRQISISTAIAPVEWKTCKLNLIDAPGYFDFVGEMVEALYLADSALILLSAVSGLAVGTEKAWDMCAEMRVPRAFLINQMDKEHNNFAKAVGQLRDKYGVSVTPLQVPIMQGEKLIGYVDVITQKAMLLDGKGYKETDIPADIADMVQEFHDAAVENAAENDDELLDKYLGGDEPLTEAEIKMGLRKGIANAAVAPVFVGAGVQNMLIDVLMDQIVDLMPSPKDVPGKMAKDVKSGEEREIACDASAPFAAQVIKTVADPFVGKLSIFRVYAGTLAGGAQIYNATSERSEKVSTVYNMRGKKQTEVDKLIAGDIGAVAKLQYTKTGDTLCDQSSQVLFPAIAFPAPSLSMAISASKSGEEDKVFGGLSRLEEEDPTFTISKDPSTLQTLISGMGELHLEIITRKLRNKFGVEAKLEEPRIPFRETIRKTVNAEGRYKKQTGGHGQFGHCWIEFSPLTDGRDFEFVDKVVGGVVPRQFIPAVEKGLIENLPKGVLAGYPLVGIRATLYDGSYHSVDSSEMAFKTAARMALKKGCLEANPVLLEPILHVDVVIPDEYMGDIIGDLNRRRGRIMGMNPKGNGLQEVAAEVPQAEMFKYATDLRSMTQARGSFTMAFERYEEVPGNIAQKIIESAQKDADDED